MLKISSYCLIFFSILFHSSGSSQNLFGLITDENGSPLPGVNVGVRAIQRYSVSNMTGRYVMRILPKGTHLIEFSHIGYKSELVSVEIVNDDIERNIVLKASPLEFRPVTVTANPRQTDVFDSPQSVAVLEGRALDRYRGQSLMQSIEMMPGVSMSSGGPLSMKPIIRGVGLQRVVVAENGLRHIGQQWDDDQSPEFDAFDVDKIEVVRGPSSVIFGSDAIGGVINIITGNRLLNDIKSKLRGKLVLNGFSQNHQGAASLSLEGSSNRIIYKTQIGIRESGNLSTPVRELENTSENELNGKLQAGLIEEWGDIILSYSHYGQKNEIYPEPEAITEISPFQKVEHNKLTLRYTQSQDFGKFESHFVWQRNQQIEFNASEATEPEVDLILNGMIFDLKLHHNPIGRLFGTVGISLEDQSNATRGKESLIPEFNQWNAGAFIQEEYIYSKWNLTAGLRYDTRRMSVEEDEDLEVKSQNRNYTAFTGAAGVVYHVTDQLVLAGNIGRGWRAPVAEELFVNGVDQGGMRYKTGSSDLKPEISLNLDLSIRYLSKRLKTEIAFYRNHISDYIYLQSAGSRDSGSGLLLYKTKQADAVLTGSELILECAIGENIKSEFSADVVLAKNKKTEEWLPFIPPYRFMFGVQWMNLPLYLLDNPYLSLSSKIYLDQNRTDPLETRSGGYTLFNIQCGGELQISSNVIDIDFSVENIFNKAYADHLSRYKNYALNPGRNIILKLSCPFDIIK